MRGRVTRAGAAVVAGVVLALVAAALVLWRLLSATGDFERALDTLPASTLRASYTDWSTVREQAGPVTRDASAERVREFLDRAFDADLVSASALADSAAALERHYGVSPLGARWEVLGQDREAQVVVLAVEDDVDLEAVEGRLRDLGYAEPAGGAGQGGTWRGGADLVAALDPELTPAMHHLAVLPDEGLVVMSDLVEGVDRAVEVVQGDADGLAGAERVEESVAASGVPVSAVVWAADFACEDLTMAQADEEDQQVGEQLVADAGGVGPLAGMVMALQADRSLRVGLTYESAEQAERDLQARVDLAAGEAPGQGGSFTDRFTVADGLVDGDTVRLRLEPARGADFVFSDISRGPLLFATC